MHRIRFGMLIVPMSYSYSFSYSEINEWSKDWAKRRARLWSVTTSRQFHQKFHFTWKTKGDSSVTAQNLQTIKTFLTLELSQYRKSRSTFPSKRAGRCPQRLPPTRKRPVFVLARPTRPSCAGALLQELGHWFCSQILRLSSGVTFGSDCQMTGTVLYSAPAAIQPQQWGIDSLTRVFSLNNACPAVSKVFIQFLFQSQGPHWHMHCTLNSSGLVARLLEHCSCSVDTFFVTNVWCC